MTDLADKSCAACRAGVPPATPAEIAAYLPQLPGWRITEADGIKRLEKSFSCKNFAAALALTNRIAVIAEQENHHPAIVTEWGRVTVEIVGAEPILFSDTSACVNCGISYPPFTPASFSFNSPQGACQQCDGLGVSSEFDPLLIVPNEDLSLRAILQGRPSGESGASLKAWLNSR